MFMVTLLDAPPVEYCPLVLIIPGPVLSAALLDNTLDAIGTFVPPPLQDMQIMRPVPAHTPHPTSSSDQRAHMHSTVRSPSHVGHPLSLSMSACSATSWLATKAAPSSTPTDDATELGSMACVLTLLLLGGMATTPRPLPDTTALRPPCTDREGPATAPARMATLQQAQACIADV
eukprot:CAMPEP_0182855002 /NCGR_PEP_ID=MMETSP0034_2-20130328/1587_1 /TAXON_ID=156128 /ORGANISM="Nephroselmis pyriformis, Strain CCMP717" /LENGTH=174 /DNA_ID=CAMNT_0024985903 /DNA_START=136 /DNA_END=661 /DNA_ORIENTATION=-